MLMNPDGYLVEIVMRDFQGQIRHDYHATVTRQSDGESLVFIASWMWLLKLRVRRGALERAFKRHDKYQKKLRDSRKTFSV